MEENLQNKDEIEIDLVDLFRLLMRKVWMIILCFIAGAVLVGGYTRFLVTPQYTSSSTLYVLTKTTSVTSIADVQLGTALTTDFMTLVTTRPVLEAVIEDMDLELTYEELKGKIEVENPTDTRFLKVSVTDPDAKLACELANSVAAETADRVADVMDTDKPNVVEDAVVEKSPSSPSLLKNTAIGALIGAFLAIAVIVLRYLLDDTIKTEEDVKKYLQLNTLAAIPAEKKGTAKKETHKKRKSA